LRNKLSRDFCLLKVSRGFGWIHPPGQTTEAVLGQKSLPHIEVVAKPEKFEQHPKNSSFGIEFAKSLSRLDLKLESSQRTAAAKSSRIKSIREIVKGFYKKNLDLSSIEFWQQRFTGKGSAKADSNKLIEGRSHSKQKARQLNSLRLSSDQGEKPLAQSKGRLAACKNKSISQKDVFFTEFFSKNYPSIVQVRKRPSVKKLVQIKQSQPEAGQISELARSERQLESVHRSLQAHVKQPGLMQQLIESSRNAEPSSGSGKIRIHRTTPIREKQPAPNILDAKVVARQPQRSDIVLRIREPPLVQQASEQNPEAREPAANTQASPSARFQLPRSPLPIIRFTTNSPSRLTHAVAELSPNRSRNLSPLVFASSVEN
jgi:hypothetical protein